MSGGSRKRLRSSPPSVEQVLEELAHHPPASPEARTITIAKFMDKMKAYEISVLDVIQFDNLHPEKLLSLMWLDKLRFALYGQSIDQLTEKLYHVFNDVKVLSQVQTEEFRTFLESGTMSTVAPSKGENLDVSTVVQLVDAAAGGDEEATQSLLVKMSVTTADRFRGALTTLQQEARHPCNRGNATVRVDHDLHHLMQPFLNAGVGPATDPPSFENMFPILNVLHTCRGVIAAGQAHAGEWARFEADVLTPFLGNNAAVSAWLDPTCLVISVSGAPPQDVTNGINAINIAGPGITTAARPAQHTPGAVFSATPVLFDCQDSPNAHECALLLRHGGLPGPAPPVGGPGAPVAGPAVVGGGGPYYQIVRFATQGFSYY